MIPGEEWAPVERAGAAMGLVFPFTRMNVDERESKWGAPTQVWKSGVVPVRSDPFASRLDGQGREPGVLREISGGFGLPAEVCINSPVPRAWFDDLAVGTVKQYVREPQRVFQGVWVGKYARVCGNTNEGGEHLRRQAI